MTPQELKASILQLAIQGKLVKQRPEEGTGVELLQSILASSASSKAARKGAKGGLRSCVTASTDLESNGVVSRPASR